MLGLILWLISQLVSGSNNCCAAILGVLFEFPHLLTLQKDKQAIQYIALKRSTAFQRSLLSRGSVPN